MRERRRGLWVDAYREFLRPRTILVQSVVVVLFVVALTILGPLGTSDTMPALRRLQYFGAPAVVMFPLCYGMAASVLYFTRSASMLTIIPSIAASTLVQGLGCTAAVHTMDSVLRPVDEHQAIWTIFLTVIAVLVLCSLFIHYVVFQQVSANVSHAGDKRSTEGAGTGSETDAARVSDAKRVSPGGLDEPPSLGQRTWQPETAPESATQPARRTKTPDPDRLYRRLSSEMSHDIVYLKMDDHYVDVRTTEGTCLVHMRFADAVFELGPLGLQTHRSYWVARRHLIREDEQNGRTMVRVTGDHLVPVSRPYVPAVREALRASVEEA